MICLLCPAVAVADSLCVPCGAKLWAAKEWHSRPTHMQTLLFVEGMECAVCRGECTCPLPNGFEERARAIQEINTPSQASDFLAHLEARKALRLRESSVCSGCERIVPRDNHKEDCRRKK